MRRFRNHGITSDHFKREQLGSWLYDMVELGYNYRLSDIQCALGLSQIRKAAALGDAPACNRAALRCWRSSDCPGLRPRSVRADTGTRLSSLCRCKLDGNYVTADRAANFRRPARRRHRRQRALFAGASSSLLPRAFRHPRRPMSQSPKRPMNKILSLPIFPAMSDADVDDVIEACWKVDKRTMVMKPKICRRCWCALTRARRKGPDMCCAASRWLRRGVRAAARCALLPVARRQRCAVASMPPARC